MNLKQAIKAKLSTKGFRVVKPDQVVSVPFLLEIIKLLEKDLDSKSKKRDLEIKELKEQIINLQSELAFVRGRVLDDIEY